MAATHDPAGEPGLGPIPEANLPGHHDDVDQDKPTGPPPRPRSVVEAESEAQAESEASSDADIEVDAPLAAEAESETRPDADIEVDADADLGPAFEGEIAIEPDGQPTSEAEAEAEAAPAPNPEPQPQPVGSNETTADDGARRWPFAAAGLLAFVTRSDVIDERWAHVEIANGRLTARYGPWVLSTPLSNVRDVEVTGPYAPWKVLGPPHVSFVDRGLTFATTTERGACITFHEPVAALDPLGWLRHPGLTVTVADPESLAAALTR